MQVFFILFSVHFAVYQYINSKCLYRTHVNYIDCPFPQDCPRHGHCCACVAHHKAAGTKLPACLRGIDWQK